MTRSLIKVLLVENDAVDRMAIERAVRDKRLRIDLETASSYKEGLEKATTRGFDVILLDHNLGDGYGIDILKEVSNTPVIFITGSGDEQIAAQAVRLGAYDYLVKDPDRNYINLLQTTIQTVLERKQVEREAQEAKEKAENATRLKDKFVSLVAHDLRSPLASNIGLLNFLKNESKRPNPEKRDHILDQLIEINTRMSHLIDGLLDITRLQTGKITPKFKFLDARKVAVQAIFGLNFIAGEKGIDLKVEIKKGSRIYADPNLFMEVEQNIVSNSIKFSNPGDIVTIYIPEDKPTTIAIKDTGVGIEEDILKDIFRHEIKTTRDGTNGEKGTGLGLPYCADIMAAHRGTLTVESEVGKGSVFYAGLPQVTPHALVVHTSEATGRAIKSMLEKINVFVMEAGDEKEALEAIDKKIPDIVIMDITNPGMEGAALFKKIKSIPVSQEAPVIVICSLSENDVHDKLVRLGADDFLSKQLVSEELIPKVRKLIG
ncbi:response regulator receiver modulated diguanylate cyclase/phosphodiesterase with PAS/PAC sensor(s) [hydrothermal vent metagenome]|uniref:Response regulator receiver modulated diguanylate cyclase/phosphodiesterase with PAS/PAC sensor(S) n=1 Tax=hydrothermal vent metagenome TaxID=652676 RepID=A0A3B1D2X4_9ZZZZ